MPEVAKWLRQTRSSTSLWPGIGPSDTASRRVSTPPTAASRPHRTRDGLLFYPWLDRIEKEGWVMVNLFPQEMNGAGARMPFCAWMAAND